MKTLIVGMGATGLSMARFLPHCGADGANAEAVDTRKNPPQAAAFRALLGARNCHAGEDIRRWTKRRWNRFDSICLSPGAPPAWLEAAFGKECLSSPEAMRANGIWSELSLLRESSVGRKAGAPALIMITGTNGKSTVAALVAALCRAVGANAQVIGNFGFPMLDAWREWRGGGENFSARKTPPPDAAVMELSSFQLQYAPSFPPDGESSRPHFGAHAAAVLNVSPDHLDYHGGVEEYAAAKSRIYNFAGYCVINLDDAAAARMGAARSEVITFSAKREADWRADGAHIIGGGMRFLRKNISPSLSVENALAGLALFFSLRRKSPRAGAQYGRAPPLSSARFSSAAIARVLADFPGLPHRRRRVSVDAPFAAVDDSKSTNVASACFALRQTRGDIVLIAGGDGKGQDFSPLAAACRPAKGRAIKKVLLFGKDAPKMRGALRDGGVRCAVVADMAEAVAAAAKVAKRGDTVLLSPACSSLDMYPNYAARGDDFAAACRALQTPQKERSHAAQ